MSSATVQIVSPELYTAVRVAKMTKIPRATLQHWIATRKIAAPRVNFWSDAQIEKARELKGTLKPGPSLDADRS
jgi:hypothetical protein